MRMRLLLSPWAIAGVMLCSYDAGEAATRARALADTVINDAPVRLAAGEQHTCQIKEDGTVRCWGSNFSGQLGDGTIVTRPTPVTVSGIANAVAIAVGGAHTCALLAGGSVRCWGYNLAGQLGDGTTIDRHTPVSVVGLANAVAIAAGGAHTCALLADGSAALLGREHVRSARRWHRYRSAHARPCHRTHQHGRHRGERRLGDASRCLWHNGAGQVARESARRVAG